MAWEHLSINRPHLVYIILGGFTSLFMLCSSIIKERLYIGEATVATICGIIFGPHAADLINPLEWGNTDQITLEFSRIVLVVQCFAVGVELPKHYMEKHWRSVVLLLLPVMTFGWLITSLFIWGLWHAHANWLDSLCIAACVTATDPVLASSVVGKGKFAKRVPKHLRDLLSAESGCNDGMAFPFIYLAVYIIRYKHEPSHVALHWFCVSILYECVFGAIFGITIGYIARRLIRLAHERDYIDRESFLVFYFVLALFCAGSGALLGMDDLLVGFACGVGFSNDGWFTEKTEESHVSNVIDLLINLTFFVYFGTIIPWRQFNAGFLGLDVWRFVVLAFLVLFFRRIPIMLSLKPVIPDIKTWREALFAGHFGPIGVGGIFVAILARAELEHIEGGSTTPLAELPPPGFPHRNIIELIWPITTFLVITSIIVHGSSIAVFTLGKHINTLTLTMSYTRGVDENNWMDRLPRIQSRSKSQMSGKSDTSMDEKGPLPPGMLPTVGRGPFLRRQKAEDDPNLLSSRSAVRHRSKHSAPWPVSQSAIAPQPRKPSPSPEKPHSRSDSDTLAMKSDPPSSEEKKQGTTTDSSPDAGTPGEIFEEGQNTVFEDESGNVLAVEPSRGEEDQKSREARETKEGRRLMREEAKEEEAKQKAQTASASTPERPGKSWRQGLRKMSTAGTGMFRAKDVAEQPSGAQPETSADKSHGPARAYQFGNTIIVEDEDGEVIKKYDIPGPERKQSTTADPNTRQRLNKMGKMLGLGPRAEAPTAGEPSSAAAANPPAAAAAAAPIAADDDERLRFTITTGGRRMSKAEFIDQIRDMDPKRRVQAVEDSNAPEPVKREARKEAREQAAQRGAGAVPVVPEEPSDNAEAKLEPAGGDEGGLKLVSSTDGREIPFHDISADLATYSFGGETAAARRRRREAPQDDSDDDAGMPPTTSDKIGETAAERRRREGALGMRVGEEESDSEEDDRPRQVPQQNIRFADAEAGGGERKVKWGKNVGR